MTASPSSLPTRMSTEEKSVRVIEGKLKLNSTVTPFKREDDFEETPKNSWETVDATIYDVRTVVFLFSLCIASLLGLL